MTVSTLTVVPGTSVPGTTPAAEPTPFPTWQVRSPFTRDQVLARTASPDYWQWLHHIAGAAGCTSPIRLAGTILRVEAGTDRILSMVDTASMPDGVIYKPCGNRRASVCPACSRIYQRDAYHVIRSGLVGGKGVPEDIATHPAVFATLTAPGFGAVHTRAVPSHTCTSRRLCDCRPKPCHPGRNNPTCPHGRPLVCFARHEPTDPRLGTPLCLDCYDYNHHVVWNNQASELWRRTTLAATRHLRRTARQRGIHPKTVKLSFGKVAELQRRGVAHYHAVIRLDGTDPDDQTITVAPLAELGLADLVDAVEHAAQTTSFTTPTHPAQPDGWPMAWGTQFDLRVINAGADGTLTDSMVAGYLSKYATKSTEATGHSSRRLDPDSIDVYADPDGSHPQRLVEACWMLGRPGPWRSLRRWAHMLGFGGHFLTKSRGYSITFRFLRDQRIVWQRNHTAGPQTDDQVPTVETTLVVNFLQFVGAGWHTTGDALLANTAADMARRRREAARHELAALGGSEPSSAKTMATTAA